MKRLLSTFMALFFVISAVSADITSDFETFKTNYRAEQTLVPSRSTSELNSAKASFTASAFNLTTGVPVSALKTNDYKSHLAYWTHIYNLATLHSYAKTYTNTASTLSGYTGDAAILELLVKSVNWYFDNKKEMTEHNYHETYTYHDDAIIPYMDYTLGTIYDEVIAAQPGSEARRAYDAMLNFGDYELDQGYQVHGANWSFRVYNHCFRHVYVSNDPARLTRLKAAIHEGLTPTKFETTVDKATDGFYPDGMIVHHGEMCYFTMYGKEMVDKHIDMNHFIKNTAWQYTDEEWSTLAFLFWEGIRHGMYRGNPEYSTGPKRASELANRIEWATEDAYIIPTEILKYAKGRTEYDERFASWIENNDRTPEVNASEANLVELDEHKYFWTGDYQIHRRNEYYIATRRSSLRVRAPEDAGTDDGKMHLHYGSGYTPILVRGDEYRVARIGWDWATLPGTTNELGSDIASGKAGSRKRNNTAFSGGLSDDKYGVGGFIYNLCLPNSSETKMEPICAPYAHKSNFYFDEGMLALGSNIKRVATPTGSKKNIITTLDQKRSETNMTYSVDDGAVETMPLLTAAKLNLQVTDHAWFWHSNVGYIVYAVKGIAQVDAVIEQRALNSTLRNEKEGWGQVYNPGLTVSERSAQKIWMWQLSINHGTDPDEAQYCYMVLPNITQEELVTYAANRRFNVETLTNEAHVVKHADVKMYQGVFYTAGKAELKSGGSITVKQPLVMQIRRKNDTEVVVTGQNANSFSPLLPLVPACATATGYIGNMYYSPVGMNYEGLDFVADNEVKFDFRYDRNYEGQPIVVNVADDIASTPNIEADAAWSMWLAEGVLNFSQPCQQVALYTLTGKVVYTSSQESSTVDVSNLAKGCYLVVCDGRREKVILP